MSALALAGSLALAAPPALACTPAPGYRVPTNLELAAQADAIVLGRVAGSQQQASEGVPGEDEADPAAAALVVHPVAALKGLLPGQDFPLQGMMLATGELGQYARPSDPMQLKDPHPSALAGACIRRVFAPGAQVLFFLDRRGGEWVPAGGPFSRWAEDVTDPTSPWFELTRFYVRLAALPPDQRTALLEAERDALLARTDDEIAQAMGADIARQLAGPNPPLVPPLPAEEAAALGEIQRGIDALAGD